MRPVPLASAVAAAVLGFALGTGPARAQQADARAPTVLEYPMAAGLSVPPYRVIEADAQGTLRLQLRDDLPPQFARFLTLTEGYYVLMAPMGARGRAPHLFRVRVDEVGPNHRVTLSASAAAARELHGGEPALLIRPLGSTTALLRGLPDEIPFDNGDQARNDVEGARQDAFRVRSANNLRQIALALFNFESAHGSLPPAVLRGPDGKPWHSWRVLILPYLEQLELYRAYDFSQPWDSEKNLKLLDRMPDVYRDPVYGPAKDHFTHYAALVGPATAFRPAGGQFADASKLVPAQGGVKFQEILDGTSNTIAIAPVAPERKIPWMKPEDLSVGPDFPGMGVPEGIATPYRVGNRPDGPGAAPVVFLDGSVHVIASTIRPAVLRALTTIAGGEIVSTDAIPRDDKMLQRVPEMLRIRVDGSKAAATLKSP